MHHSSAHRPPRWKAQTSAPQLLRAQAHAAQLLRAPRRVVGQQAEREDADAPQHLRATRHHAPRGARALHRVRCTSSGLYFSAPPSEQKPRSISSCAYAWFHSLPSTRHGALIIRTTAQASKYHSSARSREVVRGHCREEQSGRELCCSCEPSTLARPGAPPGPAHSQRQLPLCACELPGYTQQHQVPLLHSRERPTDIESMTVPGLGSPPGRHAGCVDNRATAGGRGAVRGQPRALHRAHMAEFRRRCRKCGAPCGRAAALAQGRRALHTRHA